MTKWQQLNNIVQSDDSKFKVLEGGFQNWNFEDLVYCKSFASAYEIAKQYQYWCENCKLRQTMRMMQDGDTYIFTLVARRHKMTVLTSLEGIVTSLSETMSQYLGKNIKEILKDKTYIFTFEKSSSIHDPQYKSNS